MPVFTLHGRTEKGDTLRTRHGSVPFKFILTFDSFLDRNTFSTMKLMGMFFHNVFRGVASSTSGTYQFKHVIQLLRVQFESQRLFSSQLAAFLFVAEI
jgi:hypothetical protein